MCNWNKNNFRVKNVEVKGIVVILMIFFSLFNMSAKDYTADLPKAESESTSINTKSDELISRNLFVEFWGPSLGIGLGYDQRFRPNSVFGFRAGIAYTNGSCDDAGYWGAYDGEGYRYVKFKGVTLPLEANAIFGKRASKFELGIGATPSILNRNERFYLGWPHGSVKTKDGVRLNIFGTMNIGYRLQRKSGFFFRVGLTFLVGDLDCSPFDGLLCMPNLSFGYTIR